MIKLGQDEQVIYEIRRHWYILLAESLFLVLFFLVPWFVFFGIDVLGVSLTSDEGTLLFFGALAWLFITWIAFLVVWTNYYLDVWLVTNRRIIDIEQHTLFSRDVSEFRLDRIQDVTIEVKGILPTLLHFGDIHVQTAGETREFIIRHVPRPYKARDLLVQEHDKAVNRMRGASGH